METTAELDGVMRGVKGLLSGVEAQMEDVITRLLNKNAQQEREAERRDVLLRTIYYEGHLAICNKCGDEVRAILRVPEAALSEGVP